MVRERTVNLNRLVVWTRTAASAYLLKGEKSAEAPVPLLTPKLNQNSTEQILRVDIPLAESKVKVIKKKFARSGRTQHKVLNATIRTVIDGIIEEWPLEISDDLINICTTSVAFKRTFLNALERAERRGVNLDCPLRNVQGVRNLLETASGCNVIFSKFISAAESKGSARLKDAVAQGRRRHLELGKIRRHGSALRKQAVLVPLERASDDELASLKGKQLVELKEDLDRGIRSGLFSSAGGEPNYVLLDKKVHRICAPSGDATQAWALVLWTKDDANDSEPSEEKIFGGIIYNIDQVSDMFAIDNSYSQLQTKTAQHFTLNKTDVKRNRTVGGGKMVKGPGPHSVFHIAYDSEFKANTHFETEQLGAFIEARYYYLMDGFLPEYSNRLMAAARRSNLINDLGTPRLSTFCTYQYSASSHTDNDDSPTMGWVTKRPESIAHSTGNFVWTSHRVLVEMAPNMLWFWDGSSEAHGTTISESALLSGNLKIGNKQIKENADSGQWTSVFVLPKRVTKAFARK